MVEVIAASGFESATPMRGQHTFTANLKKELQDCLFRDGMSKEIPAVYLHTRLINRLKRYIPTDGAERRITPIHYYLAHGRTVRSIGLKRWEAVVAGTEAIEVPSSPIRAFGNSETPQLAAPTYLQQLWPDRNFQHDKVLIAINLSRSISHDLDMASFRQWLQAVPALVDFINIEAIYKSNSTLMLASVSIAVWDMLPEHFATNFVGFISSGNLKDRLDQEPEELRHIPVRGHVDSGAGLQSLVGPQPRAKARSLSTSSSESDGDQVFSVDGSKTQHSTITASSVTSAGTSAYLGRPPPTSFLQPKIANQRLYRPVSLRDSPLVAQTTQVTASLSVLTGSANDEHRSDSETLDVHPRQTRLRNIVKDFIIPPRRSTYKYKEIQSHKEIRLLRLFRGPKGTSLRSMLFTTRMPETSNILSEAYAEHDEYLCLSYSWGQEHEVASNKLEVFEDTGGRGQQTMTPFNRSSLIYIRDNLEAALLALRRDDKDISIWVDAACINMANKAEWSEQVSHMQQIFSGAESVYAWLGRGHEQTKTTFDIIRPNKRDFWLYLSHSHAHKLLEAMALLLGNLWFSRRWVAQEVMLPRSVILKQGREEISWLDFLDAMSLVSYYCGSNGNDMATGVSRFKSLLPTHVNTWLNATELTCRSPNTGDIQQMVHTLECLVTSHFAHFKSSDPRDAIFSVLALAKDTTSFGPRKTSSLKVDPRVAPDYTKLYLDVFGDFVEYCIEQSQSLDIICRRWAPSRKRGDGHRENKIPSWLQPVDRHSLFEPLNARTEKNSVFAGVSCSYHKQPYSSSTGLRPKVMFGKTATPTLYALDSQETRSTRLSGSLLVKGLKLGQVIRHSNRISDTGKVPNDALKFLGMPLKSPYRNTAQLTRLLVADRDSKGCIAPPWYRHVTEGCLKRVDQHGNLDLESLASSEDISTATLQVIERMQDVLCGRKFFSATSARLDGPAMIGVGPGTMRQDDTIAILYGCSVPVILREMLSTPEKYYYKLIGECYVHDYMDGQAFAHMESPPEWPYQEDESFIIV